MEELSGAGDEGSAQQRGTTKAEVVRALREIASLLEYRGESVFRVRAYENAAAALAADPSTLEDLLAAPGRLEKVKGIGKAIAEMVRETAASGASRYHVELREGTPAGLFELMQVPGLGTKKIQLLFEKLGIATVADLEREAQAGSLESLAGFGKKTAEKILAGIGQMKRFTGQALMHHARLAAEPILAALRACPAVVRIEAAGSLRRGKEVVRDLDFVASSDRPDEVMDAFVTFPGVLEVLGHGTTKSSVLLDRGLQADLRVVPDSEFASALHHFTGSREHNIELRARAVAKGLRISEYGLFRELAAGEESEQAVDANEGEGSHRPEGKGRESKSSRVGPGAAARRAKRLADAGAAGAANTAAAQDAAKRGGERIPIIDEAALFAALGLAYIEPELREGMGEIDAAARNALPKLVEFSDYRGVLHVHSTWSDGKDSISDMATAARDEWGWQYIAICDHSEVAAYAGGVKRADVPRQHAEIDAVNAELSAGGAKAGRKTKSEFRVLKSCECDILGDGSLDYPDEILAEMDLVVASVHSRFQMPAAEMTERLLRALDNPYVTILGHMTGRLLLARDPYDFDMERVLRRAADTGTAVEINADPRRLDLDWRYCRRAKELGCIFSVNPDAHSASSLANVRFGITMARKAGLEAADIINCLPFEKFQQRVAHMRALKLARLKN